MVEHLGVDPAALAPRRDHVHRHPRAEAVGLVAITDITLGVPFEGGVGGGLATQRAVLVQARRGRRGDVVEEAVVLVEHHQQRGLAPDLRVGGQRVEYPGSVLGPPDRAGRAGVFGVLGRGDDPGHLRQAVGQHVALQRIELPGAQAVDDQRRVRRRGAVLAEADQRVVGEVVGHVLVDPPGDAGSLQALGIGGPGVALLHRAVAVVVVGGYRTTVLAERVVGAGPEEQPVGVGAALERAVIGVADSEGVGHRELEGDVLLLVVAQGTLGLGRQPLVHAPFVPGLLGVRPGVRGAVDALGAGGAGVEVVGQDLALAALLVPDPLAIGQRDRHAVAEAADALEGAEIVVEGAVLLHQDHHVLDVLEVAMPAVRGNRQGRLDARRQHAGGDGGADRTGGQADEASSAFRNHRGTHQVRVWHRAAERIHDARRLTRQQAVRTPTTLVREKDALVSTRFATTIHANFITI